MNVQTAQYTHGLRRFFYTIIQNDTPLFILVSGSGPAWGLPDVAGVSMILKIRGNKEIGYSIAIPIYAYNAAMQPKAYDCVSFQDGTLVYQPVKL
jgi:hypothetical protein